MFNRWRGRHSRDGVGAVLSNRSVHVLHGQEATLGGAKRELLSICRLLHDKGWVANHDGNVSVRLPGGRFVISPTALSKRVLQETDLIVVDDSGRVLQGGRRPFSEFKMHLAAYNTRPDVNAVLHAHPPVCTGLAVAGVEVQPAIIAEAVVSLGNKVPLVPYHFPNSADLIAALAEAAAGHDVVTMANHGVLGWGDDLEQAFLRVELVEHLATIQLNAQRAGSVRTIPASDVTRLLEKRAKAGLGPDGRRLRGKG
jgi:L-fuculose-phosphate aldolase